MRCSASELTFAWKVARVLREGPGNILTGFQTEEPQGNTWEPDFGCCADPQRQIQIFGDMGYRPYPLPGKSWICQTVCFHDLVNPLNRPGQKTSTWQHWITKVVSKRRICSSRRGNQDVLVFRKIFKDKCLYQGQPCQSPNFQQQTFTDHLQPGRGYGTWDQEPQNGATDTQWGCKQPYFQWEPQFTLLPPISIIPI